ncbi:MAG TPA: class I lanthipeptide [Thermoanaerobaculia bacterium]|nr:class I lanthipeptide [Thermoanaerobaculia bacterium]
MKKKTDKKLSLHRESLRLLTPDALRRVEGGEIFTYSSWPTYPVSCDRNPDTA